MRQSAWGEEQPAGALPCVLAKKILRQLGEVGIVLLEHVCGASQRARRRGIPRFQQRKYLVAQPVPLWGDRIIGAVFAKLQAAAGAVGANIGAGDVQERTYQGDGLVCLLVCRSTNGCSARCVARTRLCIIRNQQRARVTHAGQPAKSTAAQEMEQHGLGLVVLMVGEGNAARSRLVGYPGKQPVAQPPGGVLR